MQVDSKSVAIDNDFLQKSLEMHRDEERIIQILSALFACLEREPIIHPLVLQHEVLRTGLAEKIFAQHIIDCPVWEDIHQNDANKMLFYGVVVSELYYKLLGLKLDMGKETVFTYWKRGSNLGEIHSVAMCLLCGCGMFLSDDGDSQKLRQILQDYFNTNIAVYTRQDVSDIAREKAVGIPRSDLKSFAHRH